MLNSYLTRKEQLILLFIAVALVAGGIVLYAQSDGAAQDFAQEAAGHIAPELPPDSPRHEQEPLRLGEQAAAAGQPPTEGSEETVLRVAVRGAVISPGLYTFDTSADPRVEDLLEAAGGLEHQADTSDINVAARLIDGTTLTIPGEQPQEPRRGAIHIRRESAPYVLNPPQYTVSGWRPEPSPSPSSGSSGSSPAHWVADGLININTATQAELETLPGIGPVYAARIVEYRERTPFQTVDELINIRGIGDKRLENIRPLVAVR